MQATVMAVDIGEMSISSKIGTKSLGDGIQDICKDTESSLGPFCWLLRLNYPEVSFFNNLNVTKATS